MFHFVIDVFEGVRFAFRALIMNKMRAALTTLGIVIGVTTVILMITIIMGLDNSVTNSFSFLGSNTVYVSRWTWFNDDNWREQMKRPEMKVKYADVIKDESTLAEAVSPFAQTNRTVGFQGGRISGVQIFGVTQDYLVTNSTRIDLGRFLNAQDVDHNSSVCVIGTGVADRLFSKVGAIGQKLDVGGFKYHVIGVHAKMGKFFGQPMDDFVIIPIGAWQKQFGRRGDMDIVVKAVSAEAVPDLEWELRGIMRRTRGLTPLEPDDFGINAQSQIMQIFRAITSSIKIGGMMIAFISLRPSMSRPAVQPDHCEGRYRRPRNLPLVRNPS